MHWLNYKKFVFSLIYLLLVGPSIFAQRPKIEFAPEETEWLKAHPRIVVGFDSSWAPFEFEDAKGRQQGISFEILKLIKNYTGLEFISITGNWDDTVDKFKNGEIDLLSAVLYNKNREAYGLYTSPYYIVDNFIFVKSSNKDIRNFEDLYGKTVALPKGYTITMTIKQEYPQIKIFETKNILDSLLAVINGQADATIESQAIVNYIMQKNSIGGVKGIVQTKLESSELCMLINKDLPILKAILQKALDVILQKDIIAIKQKFFISSATEDKKYIKLSDAEESWLRKHAVVRFTGDPNWLPYEAFNKDGEYIGIVADYLKLIEKRLNIKFKKIPSKSWDDAVEMAKTGKVDVLSETTGSDLKTHLIFTQGYQKNPIVIIMDKDHPYVENLNNLKNKKVAVIKDYGYVSKIFKKYPSINFMEVETIQEGLEQVSTGKIDALLCTMALGSYHIAEMNLNNIKAVGKTDISTELGLGVRKELAALVPILNKAINSITKKESQNIKDSWIKSKYVEKTDYTLLWQISGVLLFILIITLFWTHKVHRIKNEIKRHDIFLNTVMDTQTQLIITTDVVSKVMLTANKPFFDIFGYHNVDEFRKDYKCICDLFDKDADPEEYLLMEMPDGSNWIEYMRANPGKLHKAVINWKGKRWVFSVSWGDLSSLDKKMCLVVFNDITEMEKATKKLEGLSRQLSKYLSPQIYDMIFSGKHDVQISSKRKKLTVFFSDIVGFTPMTENLESEELTELLNNYLTEMATIALKYGATIDKYIGDAIVIFFGDPESKGYKEDALACVRMAIEMQQKNQEIAAKLVDEGIVEQFSMRIGINTGYCTVGNFGSNECMDYTIIGGSVNLASRLETNCEPGKILISHETYSLVKDNFEFDKKEPIKVKGMYEPVNTYQVVKEKGSKDMNVVDTLTNLGVDIKPEDVKDVEKMKQALLDAAKSLDQIDKKA